MNIENSIVAIKIGLSNLSAEVKHEYRSPVTLAPDLDDPLRGTCDEDVCDESVPDDVVNGSRVSRICLKKLTAVLGGA